MKFSFLFELSPWFIILCIVIAFGYAFLLYFRDKKIEELSKFKKRLLFGLRFFSTLIIALLLLSPVFKSVNRYVEKPIIIYAIDNSQSIKLSGVVNSQNQTDYQDKILNSLNIAKKDFEIVDYSFGNELSDTLKFDFSDTRTDLSNIISQINNRFYNKNIGALVIVSDGIFNKGVSPLYNISNTSYPIYTIGIGDTTIHKDLLIKDIDINEIAFLNNRFPINVTVAAKKLKGQNAVCNIYSNGIIIASQSFSITNDNYLQTFSFLIDAKKTGVQQYTVSLSVIDGERNTDNNRQVVAIDVIENRQKILILANSPHPDLGAINNSLKTNQNFEVEIFTIAEFNKKISDYSLVILHQLPAKNKQFNNIYQQIVQAKIPVMFICGTQSDYIQLNNLNIGVKVEQQKSAFEYPSAFVNPNFSDFEISEEFKNIISTAPPLITAFGNYKVLANTKPVLFQNIKNIKTDKPLLVLSAGNSNLNSNIVFLLGEDIWRWRMHCFKMNNNFEAFDNFFNQIIQYLIININRNRFIVRVNKINTENSEIIFKAEAYNKIYELTNISDAFLKITDSTGKNYEFTFGKSEKAYTLNTGSFPVGSYTYTANTDVAGEKLITSGKFVVIKSNIENQNLVADFNLMYDLANKTGGKFYLFKNIDSLNDEFKNNENIVPISYEIQDLTEFVKFKFLFFFILAILSIEWFLRKFFGTY